MEGAKEKDVLINRTQMLKIAREYRIFVSKSTIHRWSNESEFPYVKGIDGKNLLYSRYDFIMFLKQRLSRIQKEH